MRSEEDNELRGWRERLLLSLPAVAGLLDISERTVRRLVAQGELEMVKVRGSMRVSTASVRAYYDRITGKTAEVRGEG